MAWYMWPAAVGGLLFFTLMLFTLVALIVGVIDRARFPSYSRERSSAHSVPVPPRSGGGHPRFPRVSPAIVRPPSSPSHAVPAPSVPSGAVAPSVARRVNDVSRSPRVLGRVRQDRKNGSD